MKRIGAYVILEGRFSHSFRKGSEVLSVSMHINTATLWVLEGSDPKAGTEKRNFICVDDARGVAINEETEKLKYVGCFTKNVGPPYNALTYHVFEILR